MIDMKIEFSPSLKTDPKQFKTKLTQAELIIKLKIIKEK
jgi:hypothetical protein